MPKATALIGVVHLPALPGAPLSHGHDPSGCLQHAGEIAIKEAELFKKAGFEGIILENFGDIPFYKDRVPSETVASMAVIAAAVRQYTDLKLGINILRNDSLSALSVAAVTGCDFIRVNVLSGVAATDQGLIEGRAADLIRERTRFHANVAILADVHVKHSKSLSTDDIEIALEDTIKRALADGVIFTGATTGRMMEIDEIQRLSKAAHSLGTPCYVGSGLTAESAIELKGAIDGMIVSSALRKGGQAGAPLDEKRMKEFVKAFKSGKGKKRKS
jgi:membrane complex biogenesis BtpA family protein